MNAKIEEVKNGMGKIKISVLLPWLVAAGFALLFLSTLITKTPEKAPLGTQIGPATLNQRTAQEAIQNSTEGEKETTVAKVLDGDTIELIDGTRVRYIGIDTPETGQCGGEEARKENTQLVGNKEVTLETDIQKFDRYGRTLAYIFVAGVFVNEELLKRGVATVTTYPPNVKYIDKFLKAQQEAKEQEKGLWAQRFCAPATPTPSMQPAQVFDPEAQIRRGDPLNPLNTQPAAECLIKGNISSSGEKIYHMPGQRYFEKTKIEEGKGERWFCTEEEAQKAGWRKSKV